MLARFPQVTNGVPSHRIRTTDCTPIRQKPYRIPQAYQEKVIKELEGMERNGIIEKPSSERASPLVIATKKDGGVCLCVDLTKSPSLMCILCQELELLDKIGN